MARVVIVLEGGLVQEVLSDQPIDYAIVDYDTEGADEDCITPMPQDKGEFADCCGGTSTANVIPERVAVIFEAFGYDCAEVSTASPTPASTGTYANDYELGS